MKKSHRRLSVLVGLFLVIGFLAHDSLPHFSESLVLEKRSHRSAQRNWNLFYGQRFVYYDSALRYQKDFNEIEFLIEPGHLVLSDHATSYYASAKLPVYVRNIHHHHGLSQSRAWNKILSSRAACSLGVDDKFSQFKTFLLKERHAANSNKQLKIRYVLVNKDTSNLNLRYECLWKGRMGFTENIKRLATIKYEGEFLNLYEFDDDLTATSSKSH